MCDYITCFFRSAAAAFYCELTATKALRWERTQDFVLAGFLSPVRKDPPLAGGFGAGARRGLCPAGAAGRELAGSGAGAHAELRGQPGCAAPPRPGAGLANPTTSPARPPANFSKRVPAPAVPRSQRIPQRLSPVPHTHRRGPGTACVSGEPRWRAGSRCSAPPAASRALTAAARAVPPLRTGTGREPPLGSARFPPAHRKARGQRPPAPERCCRWSAAHLPGCCCCCRP